jgi:predicted nucleotidyltransferase
MMIFVDPDMMATNPFGLSPEAFDQIIAIVSQCPAVEQAILFGSRAAGTYKTGSDVDLAVRGKDLGFQDILFLKGAFEESTLPYFFDVIWDHPQLNADLRRSVITTGVSIYQRGSHSISPLIPHWPANGA